MLTRTQLDEMAKQISPDYNPSKANAYTDPSTNSIYTKKTSSEDIQKMIDQARASKKAGTSAEPTTEAPKAKDMSEVQSRLGIEYTPTGNILKDTAQSGMQFLKDIASSVIHPVKTAKSLGNIALGLVDTLVDIDKITGEDKRQYVDAVANFYKNKYGSSEKALEAVRYDPIGFLSDAATVLAGGAGAVKGGAKVAGAIGKTTGIEKISKAADIASDVSKGLSKASMAIDPLAAIEKGVSTVKKILPSATPKGAVPAAKSAIGSALQKADIPLTDKQVQSVIDYKIFDKDNFKSVETLKGKISSIQEDLGNKIVETAKSINTPVDAKNLSTNLNDVMKNGYTPKVYDELGNIVSEGQTINIYQKGADGSLVLKPLYKTTEKVIKQEMDYFNKVKNMDAASLVAYQSDLRKKISANRTNKPDVSNAYQMVDNMIKDYIRDTKPDLAKQLKSIWDDQSAMITMEDFADKYFNKDLANKASIVNKMKQLTPLIMSGGGYMFGGIQGAILGGVGIPVAFKAIDWFFSPSVQVAIGKQVDDFNKFKSIPDEGVLRAIQKSYEALSPEAIITTSDITRVLMNALEEEDNNKKSTDFERKYSK